MTIMMTTPLWWQGAQTLVSWPNRSHPNISRYWIRGLQNSGTNFAAMFLRMNGAIAARSDMDPLRLGCWKHMPPWWFPSNLDPESPKLPAAQVLVIVRHPLAWAQSMMKTHYEIHCDDWKTMTRCSVSVSFCHSLACPAFCTPPDARPHAYLEDLWSQYTQEWILARHERRVLVTRYEDAVLNPDAFLHHIGLLSFRRPAKVPQLPSKRHGHSHNYSTALQSLVTPVFSGLSPPSLITRVCERTRAAREKMGYTCPKEQDQHNQNNRSTPEPHTSPA